MEGVVFHFLNFLATQFPPPSYCRFYLEIAISGLEFCCNTHLSLIHAAWIFKFSSVKISGKVIMGFLYKKYTNRQSLSWGVDHNGHLWHHLSTSLAAIVWKVVGQHLFLNIFPRNFTARTKQRVWCHWGMSVTWYFSYGLHVPWSGNV